VSGFRQNDSRSPTGARASLRTRWPSWNGNCTQCVQIAAQQREALLRDIAGYNALERGIDLASRDIVPDITAGPIAHALASDAPVEALRAVGVRVLGSGAYGIVLAGELVVRRVVSGEELVCRLPCAIKTLWHAIVSPYNVAAFLREVQISSRIVHPHIVRTYGSVPGPPRCLVMEPLVCSLADLLTATAAHGAGGGGGGGGEGRVNRLTHREALDACIGVASGVSVLRSHRVVHGDVRLENVLLDGDMTPKVSDLGTARTLAELGGGTAGAPVQGRYCAPERAARAPNVMAAPYAWDVYSLSVLVVEVLTGERADQERWPSLLPRLRHAPLRDAVVDAHRADPEARCSAEALLNALRGAAWADEYSGCPPRRRIVRREGELRLV
jgi:serine/threonine protein kinase